MRIFFNFIAFWAVGENAIAAEAGMPQLNPEYWASQTFWLIVVFTILYLSISKFFIPKIKDNLDDREKRIKEDLSQASKFREEAEMKSKEYLVLMEKTKKDVLKIMVDSKKNLDKQIQMKKSQIDKEIENELEKSQKEIVKLKKESVEKINLISKNLASKIIEDITGEKLNESSVEAIIKDVSKNKLEKII